jgi:hypothetical protein
MRKVFGIIPLLLITLLANASPIEEAWKECDKVLKQRKLKKHLFLTGLLLLPTLEQKLIMKLNLAMMQLTRQL